MPDLRSEVGQQFCVGLGVVEKLIPCLFKSIADCG